jgi:hypothetical protein
MKLTDHFTLEELTATSHRQFDNTPDPAALANLQRLAEFLEVVKATLGGKPVIITSGYRSKAVNDSVGSSDKSAHRIGCAADFKVPGMTPEQVVKVLVDAKLPFMQCLREFDAWTHISIPNTPDIAPSRQALIIDKAGTRIWTPTLA